MTNMYIHIYIRNHKVERIVREIEMKQTNKHNEKTKTFFYFVFFLLTGIICVGVKPKRHG